MTNSQSQQQKLFAKKNVFFQLVFFPGVSTFASAWPEIFLFRVMMNNSVGTQWDNQLHHHHLHQRHHRHHHLVNVLTIFILILFDTTNPIRIFEIFKIFHSDNPFSPGLLILMVFMVTKIWKVRTSEGECNWIKFLSRSTIFLSFVRSSLRYGMTLKTTVTSLDICTNR